MKFRLLAVIVLTTTVFFASLIWLLDSFFYGDRGTWAEMSLRTQVSVTSEAVASESKFLQRWVSFASEDKLKQINWSAFSPYVAVGVLQKVGSGWALSEWTAEPKSAWAKMSKENFQAYLVGLGLKEIDKSVHFISSVDNEKRASVFSFVPTGHRVWFFVHSGEALQSVIDSQKGNWSSLGIINSEGLTLAHSVPEYIGQKMGKSSFQEDLLKGQTVSGSGIYQLGEAQVFAYFQKVPDLNASVYSTMPVAEVMKGRKKLLIQLSLLALGLILTTSSFIIRFSAKEDEDPVLETLLPEEDFRPLPLQALSPAPTNIAAEAPMEPAVLQKEKMDAYVKMASAVGHELKSPLVSVMGYGQSLLAKVTDGETRKMVEALLSEARISRTVLDKLFVFAGEKVQDRTLMKVETPLLRALKNMEPLLTKKGVKVVKTIQETQALKLNSEDLIRAFENIISNSVEAMERQAEKEIEVKLQDTGSNIEVTIRDKGEGIDQQNLKKIFEPFFTTRSAKHQLGLGLSVSHGIFKEHSAQVDVQSQMGKGTTFRIQFEKTAQTTVKSASVEKTNLKSVEMPPQRPPATPTEKFKKEKTKISDIQLAIPKYNEIQLQDDGEEFTNSSENLYIQQEKETAEEGNPLLLLGETTVSTENVLIKEEIKNEERSERVDPENIKAAKPSLDVNVDQLLDLPEEKLDEDKTLVTDSGIKVKPAVEPLIGPPKKPAIQKTSARDEFKVVVRRPERKS